MFRLVLRVLISVLFLSLLATSAHASALPTRAVDIWGDGPADVSRISGENRYATSEAIARQWSGPVDVAYVVSGENYPDALSAGARAGADEAPVVLVHPDRVPSETRAALQHLRPGKIVVVGGPSAVSTKVKKSLVKYARQGIVQRISGSNRYRTNAKLFRGQASGAPQVYLASGESFPDALSAAALAGRQGVPLLLTASNGLEPAVAARLSALNADELVVIGGSTVVPDGVAQEAATYTQTSNYSRVGGTDRYETSALIAEHFDTGLNTVYVASGGNYPDALAGTALGAKNRAPVLLTTESHLSPETADALEDLRPKAVRVLGGSGAVGRSVLDELRGTPRTSCQNTPPQGTLFGSSLSNGGERAAESLANIDNAFGRVPVVRQFSSGLPRAWGSHKMQSMSGRTVVTSFKALPKSVNSGKHDDYLRRWFATAPDNQDIYWSYYHEPEGEIKAGRFGASEYREAWEHIVQIADEVCKPNMYATLILTGWTAKPASGQDYRDYDAGPAVIDVLAFDSYNGVHDPYRNYYASPEEMYGNIVAIAKREGRPFAVPETGTRLLSDDDGSRRAQWLREVGAYLEANGSLFVAYFQSDRHINWRLDDEPSRTAWSELVKR
ncbi:MAG: cell wall-binding repeat-containing protein [Ornithinimicrobium sp.]